MDNKGKYMISIPDAIKAINHGCLGIFNFAYSCISRDIKYSDHLACQKQEEEELAFSQQDITETKLSLNEKALEEAAEANYNEVYEKAYERIESIIAAGGSIFCLYRKWYKRLQEAAEIR